MNSKRRKGIKIDFDIEILKKILSIFLLEKYNLFHKKKISKFFLSFDKAISNRFDNLDVELLYNTLINCSNFIKECQLTPTFDNITQIVLDNFINDDDLDWIEGILSEIDEWGNDEETLDFQIVHSYLKNKSNIVTISKHKSSILTIAHKIENSDYTGNVNSFVESLKKTLALFNKELVIQDGNEEEDFLFGVESELDKFKEVFQDSIEKVKSPSNTIKGGSKNHNYQLSPDHGYELGRSYIYVGATNSGKSLHLLRVCYWAWRYNVEAYDPITGRRNLILFISAENSQSETCQRMYETFLPEKHVLENPYKSQSPEQILEKATEFYGSLYERYAIAFKYRKSKTLDTNDIEDMIEEYESQGYRVKMVIFDYLKRIKPVNFTGDHRLDLANVVDEFSSIAKENNCAFVSATQWNGNTIAIVEESLAKGKHDVLEGMSGSAAIGEAKILLENCDYAFLIYIEKVHPVKKSYQVFKKIKGRNKTSDNELIYFAQPFSNWMKTPHLLEDYETNEDYGIKSIADSAINEINDGDVIKEAVRPKEGFNKDRKGHSTSINSMIDKYKSSRKKETDKNDDEF